VIDKVTRGTGVAKLIYYLYGPGKHNEHTDPHLVAGYRHPAVLEPDQRRLPQGAASLPDRGGTLRVAGDRCGGPDRRSPADPGRDRARPPQGLGGATPDHAAPCGGDGRCGYRVAGGVLRPVGGGGGARP
jgi:hypothetical protein